VSLEIYRHIGNTHVPFTTDFKKVNNQYKHENNSEKIFYLERMQKCLRRYHQTLSTR
jgi:hypothetical protein